MAYIDTSEFVLAVETVETAFGTSIARGKARAMIERMHQLKGRAKFGGRFKSIRNQVLCEFGITDLIDWGIFKSVIVGYFQPRAVHAWRRKASQNPPRDAKSATNKKKGKKKERPVAVALPVHEASSQHVRIQIYSGNVFLTFRAKKPAGRLDWDDVENDPVEAPPNWPGVSKEQWRRRWRRAKKKACVIMNRERGFKPKRELSKKVA